MPQLACSGPSPTYDEETSEAYEEPFLSVADGIYSERYVKLPFDLQSMFNARKVGQRSQWPSGRGSWTSKTSGSGIHAKAKNRASKHPH